MRRIIVMCLLAVLALPVLASAAAIGPARVSYVSGEVMFRSPDSDEWLSATVNTPLDEGDAIWCSEDSRAELQLPDGSTVRLDSGSQLDVLANEDGYVHLHLASGHLYLRTAQGMKDNSLQIDADDTTVLPSARTRLRIDMLPNSLEDVAITKGSAYVEGNGSRTRVRAGEHILMEGGHNEVLALNPADSWELWNVDRDRAQSRSAKADTYLPEELRGQAAELDANGTWVRVPDYGMVWRPTVIVSDDWAPYRSGRWIWRGDDYVWLSYEPWGWAPYHYGRWAVVVGFGWCWVPPVRGDVYWGPGYVGWYRTGSHVAWTPLAPGEVFYGHRYYGRHSVNITNVTINTGTVTYRNRSNPGGLTVLPHDDFLRGRDYLRQPYRNPSVSVSVSVGSPRIRPLRETRMPIIKQTPPRVAPPVIERRDVRELRERYPRVKSEPVKDRRSQQPPQGNGRQTTFPTPDRRPDKDRVSPQPAVPRSEDRQQRSSTPPTVTQPPVMTPAQQPVRDQREERRQGQRPAPVVTGQPPVTSMPTPQRVEQPRNTPVPSDSQVRPGAVNKPTVTAPQRIEQSRPADIQPRRVWRVTTPENGGERGGERAVGGERENRGGRERR